MNSREVVKRLKAAGWSRVAQEGGHAQLEHAERPGRVTVPHPTSDLPTGTSKSIERRVLTEGLERRFAAE